MSADDIALLRARADEHDRGGWQAVHAGMAELASGEWMLALGLRQKALVAEMRLSDKREG